MPAGEGVAGELGIDLHAPAEERVGEHGAADQVRVGNRGLGAAPPVAGGAGLGAGRARADPEHAAVVPPHDRAAARAHRHDVEHGNADGQAVDLGVAGEHRRAVPHEADVGARAPHVEGDEVAIAGALRLADRAHHARRRARVERGDGVARHAARGQPAAVGLHQAEAALEPALAQRARERAEIAVDDRLHVGREHGGRRALVFAELASHVARARDADAGEALGDHRGHAPLVRGVRVAVEKADRDGLIVAALQRLGDAVPRGRLVQGCDHLAVGAHALGDLEGIAARHHRLGLAVMDVVDGAPALALQDEQVAEALGGEERDPCALALEHRVGGDGRAVHEIASGGQRQTALVERGDGAQVGRMRRARHLGDAHAAALERDEIGERAADLDPHPDRVAHACPRTLSPVQVGGGVIPALPIGRCGGY